ncbi:chemotaxis protein CheB [Pseudomonas sp. DTU_2021_1001937_2_SI_NGA_ILE_001]|uniref:chemotaxis protein CheB n=1 Tax=Pseudomonas sp. DTU_2021_1001937_2_SI_NGA_ILE_001 TaxID=3077589 RepID=UPI0025E0FF0B|nr:chemotaxis protein CheB [Pseudomonas sp. DTU_2021_1001937_2_SI_NGA_ILE_001]WNW10474.1 chemotaxis protein CheB [Pseudomonas sp. DTU_2021_1001937_2_SI_NGA_ILE_001]
MKTTFGGSPVPALPRVEAIVLGASAGGVEALLTVTQGIRRGFRLPLIVVLHLPDQHCSQLAQIFQNRLPIEVREARDKESLTPGTLYFAPAGYHLSVEDDRSLSLSQEEKVFFSRPSIDILFESAADAYGPHLVGVLLTGANADGARGLARIKAFGGLTVIQNPELAVASAMPEAGLSLHTPDYLLSLTEIRDLLTQLERIAC